jgi:hypothetical protein
VGLSERKIKMENGRIGMWEIKWWLLNEMGLPNIHTDPNIQPQSINK